MSEPNQISRRKMLATSAGALLGVSTAAHAGSPADKADVGDMFSSALTPPTGLPAALMTRLPATA